MSTDLLLVNLKIGLDTEPDWTKAKHTLAAFTPEALAGLPERCGASGPRQQRPGEAGDKPLDVSS